MSIQEDRWFTALGPEDARIAVAGLAGLAEALRRGDSSRIDWACRRRRHCPDGPQVAARIDPLSPVSFREVSDRDCPRDMSCFRIDLADPVCGGWATQLRMDRSEDGWRFRSARIGEFTGALDCGEMMEERPEPPQ